MKKDGLMQKLNDLIQPIVENLGYELYYIEYVIEDDEYYLRVYIDADNGISLEDCEKVSRKVSEILDVEDPIEDAYYLEVSSPGIYRELFEDRHLNKYKSFNICINLEAAMEGKKKLIGELLDFNDNYIYINKDGKQMEIPREKVRSVNLEGSLKEVNLNE